MAYIGKYIDRNPCIKGAGIPSNITETVSDVFKIYNIEEAAEEILKAKCKRYEEKLKSQRLAPVCPFLPEDGIQDLLSTELKKSRFVAFREKFSEDMFFKKPELGKVYALHSKPDQVTNENTTFGQKIHRSEPVYELILPHKSPEQVNREYIKWHDKYLISHHHYLPGEQINRKYDKQFFDPTSTFGITNRVDLTGANVKRCLTQCDQLIVISKAQKYFLERSMGRLGTKITRNVYDVPQDMSFGHKTAIDLCDAKALLDNIDPCVRNSKLIEAISHINKLRHSLFQRVNYSVHDLRNALAKEDKQATGFLNLSKVFDIARLQFIRFNEDKVRTALRHFDLVKDEGLASESINFAQFCKLLTLGYPLPKTGNISTLPKQIYNKETTYRKLCEDLQKKESQDIFIRPKSHIENSKSTVTTAKEVISPDIPMLLGLETADFSMPRLQCELKRIFKHLPTENFDKAWSYAIEKMRPESDMISVADFRKIINEIEVDKK